ncbi:MAG: thiamine phosphate synthase [Candidatus Gastranaerophilales bacterium]|nr:thiamine phosphate synthase [Candidatus Gastranaerophilales bacterium]
MWDKLKEQFNLLKLEKKKLYLITNSDRFVSKDDFLNAAASALQGGVDILQLREKHIPDGVFVEIGHKMRTLCDEYGATFIINDRIDIAQIVEADGVHLGQNDISIRDARAILGSNAIIGKTSANPDEIIKAVNDGADYVTFGPIYTKQEDFIDEGVINWINDNIKIPVFFAGDITLNNVTEITQTGITKIALTESIMYSRIPEQTARSFLKSLP